MRFVAPSGTELVRSIGCGSTFEVALVALEGAPKVPGVICKRVAPRAASVDVAMHALHRESTVLQRLRHPALPEWIAAGEDAHGPFLLQSHALGTPLSDNAGASPVPQAAVINAFSSLAELHLWSDETGSVGFSHGDLCPEHVFLQGSDVTLIDFGQARYSGLNPVGLEAERGTLPYVAPELVRGEVSPDAACDVYALAACFAFAILGRAPCTQPVGPSLLIEIAENGADRSALEASANAPPTVIDALLAALHPERHQRLRQASEVAFALRSG